MPTEWLRVMLEEVARKRAAADRERTELVRREAPVKARAASTRRARGKRSPAG